MKLVTQAEFGRLAGVSRQAIGQALKPGKGLRYSPGTKKIDVEDPLSEKYLADQKLLIKRGVKDNASSKPINSSSSSRQQNKSPDLSNPDVIDKLAERKAMADMQKSEGAVLRQQMLTDKERGKLIERGLVTHILSQLYIIDSNELKPLNDKLAPIICSELEIDDPEKILAVNKIIEKDIFKVLKHTQRKLDDFLISIEADPLPKDPELDLVLNAGPVPITQN